MASSSAARQRTVCETCELPFYADNDSCPYCGGAHGDDGNGEFVFEDSDEAADSPNGPTESAPGADERGGLFGRIKRTLGF